MIPLTAHLHPLLLWWVHGDNLTADRPFRNEVPVVTMTTDSSLTGWGATFNGSVVLSQSGPAHQRPQDGGGLEGAPTLVRISRRRHSYCPLGQLDHGSVHQPPQGTKSAAQLWRVWDLLVLCESLRMTLRASHLAGQQYVVADVLSRGTYDSGAWTLALTLTLVGPLWTCS